MRDVLDSARINIACRMYLDFPMVRKEQKLILQKGADPNQSHMTRLYVRKFQDTSFCARMRPAVSFGKIEVRIDVDHSKLSLYRFTEGPCKWDRHRVVPA